MKGIMWFAIIGSIFLISCTKNNISLESGFTKKSYPLNVGNWWRYKVYDVYAQSYDTLTIKIASVNTRGPLIDYNCDLSEWGVLVDTGYFEVSDTSLKYIGKNSNYSYFGEFILKLPFGSVDSWIGINTIDTVQSLAKIDSVNIIGKIYAPAYYLRRSFYLQGGYQFNQVLLLTPNIGVIDESINISSSGFPTQNQHFQLIDYKLQ